VADVVALAPDVILVAGGRNLVALQEANRTIPVVFVTVSDPVSSGFVESQARPGGNATGFSLLEYAMSGKWLELLKELAPRVTGAAVLRDPANPSGTGQLGAIMSVAPSFGAMTRAGGACQRPAIRGKKRCRLHGGLSPGAPRGSRNGNFKNGDWTSEAIAERKWLRSLVQSFAYNGKTE
jgi:hypothetical protein